MGIVAGIGMEKGVVAGMEKGVVVGMEKGVVVGNIVMEIVVGGKHTENVGMERVVGSKQERVVGRKEVVGAGNFQEIDVVGVNIQIKTPDKNKTKIKK